MAHMCWHYEKCPWCNGNSMEDYNSIAMRNPDFRKTTEIVLKCNECGRKWIHSCKDVE